MPNGGPDNCSTCGFNRRNGGVWRNPQPDESKLPFCQIRGLQVPFEHWTYCQNWHSRTPEPVGPVYSSGLYEGSYFRIPWHGTVQPEMVHSGTCHECNAKVQEGISISAIESASLAFCCNLHYLRWWTREHPQEQAPMSGTIRED